MKRKKLIAVGALCSVLLTGCTVFAIGHTDDLPSVSGAGKPNVKPSSSHVHVFEET